MTPNDWIERITQTAESGDDLMSLGEALGKDRGLTEGQYQQILRELGLRLFASEASTVLDTAIEHRPCPPPPFWRDIILTSRDPDLGGALLEVLIPWLDINEFLCGLLSMGTTNDAEQQRIGYMVWNATCGGSIAVQTGERFEMKEAIDRTRIRRSIEEAMPRFENPIGRASLTRALNCLSSH